MVRNNIPATSGYFNSGIGTKGNVPLYEDLNSHSRRLFDYLHANQNKLNAQNIENKPLSPSQIDLKKPLKSVSEMGSMDYTPQAKQNESKIEGSQISRNIMDNPELCIDSDPDTLQTVNNMKNKETSKLSPNHALQKLLNTNEDITHKSKLLSTRLATENRYIKVTKTKHKNHRIDYQNIFNNRNRTYYGNFLQEPKTQSYSNIEMTNKQNQPEILKESEEIQRDFINQNKTHKQIVKQPTKSMLFKETKVSSEGLSKLILPMLSESSDKKPDMNYKQNRFEISNKKERDQNNNINNHNNAHKEFFENPVNLIRVKENKISSEGLYKLITLYSTDKSFDKRHRSSRSKLSDKKMSETTTAVDKLKTSRNDTNEKLSKVDTDELMYCKIDEKSKKHRSSSSELKTLFTLKEFEVEDKKLDSKKKSQLNNSQIDSLLEISNKRTRGQKFRSKSKKKRSKKCESKDVSSSGLKKPFNIEVEPIK